MVILFAIFALVILTAVLFALLCVKICVAIIRLVARVLSLPFRIAHRADRVVFDRLHRSLPVRLRRGDDVQCTNHLCRSRLPIEAKFCARCGGALPAQRGMPDLHVMPARKVAMSQVA